MADNVGITVQEREWRAQQRLQKKLDDIYAASVIARALREGE